MTGGCERIKRSEAYPVDRGIGPLWLNLPRGWPSNGRPWQAPAHRRGGFRFRFLAPVLLPGFVGQLRLSAQRNVVIAIGHLRHHGTGDAGFGLCHQPLHFRGSGREALALGSSCLQS